MSRCMHVFVPVYAYVCSQRYSNTVVFFSFAVLSLQNSSCFAVCYVSAIVSSFFIFKNLCYLASSAQHGETKALQVSSHNASCSPSHHVSKDGDY